MQRLGQRSISCLKLARQKTPFWGMQRMMFASFPPHIVVPMPALSPVYILCLINENTIDIFADNGDWFYCKLADEGRGRV
jgi:hypothetical protein